MTKTEIVAQMARDRMVETMVENIAHQPLSADLKDLSQMVYIILLEYDEAKIVDLWEHRQMQYFIAKVIVNQYRSSNSPFFSLIRKFRAMVAEVEDSRQMDVVENGKTFKVIHYDKGD